MSADEVPKQYGTEMAKNVVDEIKKISWKSVYESTLKAIDEKLRQIILTMPTVAPIREESQLITLRKRTFQKLLDVMRGPLGSEYEHYIREAGENIGTSFGHDLILTLKSKGKIPARYDTLLETWREFDSSANWGTIEILTFDTSRKRIEIVFQHNFLTDGYEKNIHRHCAFLAGYLKGVVNQLFFEWIRWVEEIFYKPTQCLTCKSFDENTRGKRCIFVADLSEELLKETRNRLLEAIFEYDNNKRAESATLARSAMECMLKERVGFDTEQYLKFTSILKIYESERILTSSEASDLRKAYFKASQIAHRDKKASKEDIREFLTTTRKMIRKLEEEELTSDRLELIAKKMGELLQVQE